VPILILDDAFQIEFHRCARHVDYLRSQGLSLKDSPSSWLLRCGSRRNASANSSTSQTQRSLLGMRGWGMRPSDTIRSNVVGADADDSGSLLAIDAEWWQRVGQGT
jgi:hypothetical protein